MYRIKKWLYAILSRIMNLQDLTGGYNFVKILDKDDIISEQSSSTVSSIDILEIEPGMIIQDVTVFKKQTSTGPSTYVLEIGDDDDSDGFIAQSGFGAGVKINVYATGAYFTVGGDNQTLTGKMYPAAKTMTIKFTCLAGDLSDITNDTQFIIAANVLRPSKYAK